MEPTSTFDGLIGTTPAKSTQETWEVLPRLEMI